MPEIAELSAAAGSTVCVEVDDGAGAGSVIAHVGSNSYVLTCEHVAGAAGDKTNVVYRPGKRFVRVPAVVERVDVVNDLAIVRTSRRIDAPVIRFAAEEP